MRSPLQTVTTAISALCLVAVAAAAPAASQTGPSPYPAVAADWPGEGVVRVFQWMKPNRESFWRQRQQKHGAWVLAGDSQLGGWRTYERDLGPRPVANRGIGGDVSRGLLFRLQEDVLDLNPRGIVLLIGGNDLSALQPADKTARNIERMLEAIAAQDAALPVILCTLPPRNSAEAPIKQTELMKMNANIRRLAAAHGNVLLLDLFPLFADGDGQPRSSFFAADRLHMSAAGYKVLGEALNTKLEAVDRRSSR